MTANIWDSVAYLYVLFVSLMFLVKFYAYLTMLHHFVHLIIAPSFCPRLLKQGQPICPLHHFDSGVQRWSVFIHSFTEQPIQGLNSVGQELCKEKEKSWKTHSPADLPHPGKGFSVHSSFLCPHAPPGFWFHSQLFSLGTPYICLSRLSFLLKKL